MSTEHATTAGVQTEKESDAERLDRLEGAFEELLEENRRLREELDGVKAELETAERQRDALAKKTDVTNDELAELRDDVESGGSGEESAAGGEPSEPASPIERAREEGLSSVLCRRPRVRDVRALAVWEHLTEWGDYNAQYDRLTLRLDSTLDKLYNSAVDGDEMGEWNDRDRMAEALVTLSKGKVEHKETRSGWVLTVPEASSVFGGRQESSLGRR